MTKSESPIHAFATLRVAGDLLDPRDVTTTLGIQPTFARKKDEIYSSPKSEQLVAVTGVWMFDTSKIVSSNDLDDQVWLILYLLGFRDSSQKSDLGKVIALHSYLKSNDFKSTMTLFWHGRSTIPSPKDYVWLTRFLNPVPVAVDFDFDRDEDPDRKHKRAAA